MAIVSMAFEPKRNRLVRDAYGPTDVEKRNWNFRQGNLHGDLYERLEGAGQAGDFDRFQNMPQSADAPAGTPLAASDFPGILVKNRYNAKAYPWLEAYEPTPDAQRVFRSHVSPNLQGRDADGGGPDTAQLRPQRPSRHMSLLSRQNVSIRPDTCILAGAVPVYRRWADAGVPGVDDTVAARQAAAQPAAA